MADGPQERLFRDDGGAALERAARLEDENRRLRAELERLRRAGHDDLPTGRIPPAPGFSAFVVGVVCGTACLGIAVAFLSGTGHTRRARVRPATPVPTYTVHHPAPPVMPQPAFTASFDDPLPPSKPTVIKVSPVRRAMDPACDPPYAVGRDGVKRYKEECFK